MTSQLGLRSLCFSAQLAGLSLFACCLCQLSCNRFYTPTGLPSAQPELQQTGLGAFCCLDRTEHPSVEQLLLD